MTIDRLRSVLDRELARWSPVLALVVVVLATLLRQTGVPKVATIWAEDGPIFTGCPYLDSGPGACFLVPYHAWIHLVPRLSGELATLLPPAILPVSLALLAAIVAGLAAAVVAAAVRAASGSWAAGLVTGSSLGLVWQAGREISGNVTNLPWILLAAASIAIVAGWAGHRTNVFDLLLIGFAGLSTAFAPMLAVLAVGGLVLRVPAAGRTFIVAALATGVQGWIALTSQREPPGLTEPTIQAIVRSFLQDVVARGPFGLIRIPPGLAVTVGIGCVAVIAGVRLARRRRGDSGGAGRVGPAALLRGDALVLLVCGTLVAAAAGSFLVAVVLQRDINLRYTYVPSVLICSALVFGAALLRQAARPDSATPNAPDQDRGAPRSGFDRGIDRAAQAAFAVALIVLIAGFARSFRLEARASRGPDVLAEYAASVQACELGAPSIQLKIAPAQRQFFVTIPCDRVRASR